MDQRNTSQTGGIGSSSQVGSQQGLPLSSSGTILAWNELTPEQQQTYGTEFKYEETVKSLGGQIGQRFVPHGDVQNR